MKKRLIIILFVSLIYSLFAQSQPDTLWTRTFGGIEPDTAYDVIQTNDGGYLIAGGSNTLDAWVVKTDENGYEEWNSTYDGLRIYTILQIDDGFVLAGHGDNFWLTKITEEGTIEWDQTYNCFEDGYAYCVQETNDNGYIIAGSAFDNTGIGDFGLIKTDSLGNEEWHQSYGIVSNYDWEMAYSVQQTADEGYIVAGYVYRIGGETNDALLVKTDALGNEEWSHYYGGDGHESAKSVLQTNAGGFVFAGWTWSYGAGEKDFWLVKIDEFGNEEWDQTYGGLECDEATSFQQTADGGYIIAGLSKSYSNGESDLWFVKTDAFGNEEWNQNYGGEDSDSAEAIRITLDGNFIIAGNTRSFGAGESDFWLVRLTYPVGSINNVVNDANIRLSNYPNPFNPSTTIEFSLLNDSKVELTIYNIKGQKIKTLAYDDFTKGNHSIIWNGDDESGKAVSSSLYLYELIVNDKSKTMRKCLLLK